MTTQWQIGEMYFFSYSNGNTGYEGTFKGRHGCFLEFHVINQLKRRKSPSAGYNIMEKIPGGVMRFEESKMGHIAWLGIDDLQIKTSCKPGYCKIGSILSDNLAELPIDDIPAKLLRVVFGKGV